MNINTNIIDSYLNGKHDYSKHWVYSSITNDGVYLFQEPNLSDKHIVQNIYKIFMSELKNFKPYNYKLFNQLFPNWNEILENINIILTVGVKEPYDAMVREYLGKSYMIFDLNLFSKYYKSGNDIPTIISKLLTHEFTHICVHQDYPPVYSSYIEQMQYITFDEGFAHLLSFSENVELFDFTEINNSYYNISLEKLKLAFMEQDESKQREFLEECNSGNYWDKFACISGKLFLSCNINYLKEIYINGAGKMVKSMLLLD